MTPTTVTLLVILAAAYAAVRDWRSNRADYRLRPADIEARIERAARDGWDGGAL